MKRGRRAFTLLELIVVLAIIAVGAAVTVPAFAPPAQLSPLSRGALQVRALVQACRSTALTSGRAASLVLDPLGSRYWAVRGDSVGVARPLALPNGVRLASATTRVTIACDPSGVQHGDTLALEHQGATTLVALPPVGP